MHDKPNIYSFELLNFFSPLQDLAARNVLVNNEDVCKIADFGMSRELKTDDTYDTRVRIINTNSYTFNLLHSLEHK